MPCLRMPLWPFLVFLQLVGGAEMGSTRQCLFYQSDWLSTVDTVHGGEEMIHNTVIINGTVEVELCPSKDEKESYWNRDISKASCYAFLHYHPNISFGSAITDESLIAGRGCWVTDGTGSRGQNTCTEGSCVVTEAPRKGKFWFCCCKGDFCNANISMQVKAPEETTTTEAPVLKESHVVSDALIVVVPVVFFLLFIGGTFWMMKRYWPGRKKTQMVNNKPGTVVSPTRDMKSLQLYELIGTGRYGSVWKGSLHDQVVAVKVFPTQYKPYFLNERDIYTLPHMTHPNLLSYFGCDERPNYNDRPEYMLVLSFMPMGCLQDYLKENTVDWQTAVKMLLGVTQGLAHLHSEITREDSVKPCVTHRDLSSRNVLVGADLRCVICDFGFALKISGSVYYQNGEHKAETSSLTDVGTLRYMAPEVLEGAVNLRDCESSLTQIDVYALGLILWEISTRCHDLYQGAQPPSYQQPFEAETGGSVTFDQMAVLVCRKKARPLFPLVWKDSNPAIRLLKETIQECWDQDAEARLTTFCVKERMTELPTLWDRYKVPTSSLLSSITPSVNVTTSSSSPGNDNSVSEDTVDTTVTVLSPQESGEKNGNIHTVACIPVSRLQPHQGRNPCLERNLVLNSSNLDDMCIVGNCLFTRDVNTVDGIEDSNETHALLEPQLVPPVRAVPGPIPYLQNPMDVPKRHNIPQPQPQKSWLHKKIMGFLEKRRKRDGDEVEALTQTVDTRVCVNGEKVQTTVAECPNADNLSSKTTSTVEMTETPERMRRPNTLPLRFTLNASSQEMIPLEEKDGEDGQVKCSISSLENVQEVFSSDTASMRPLARSDCRAPTPYECRAGNRLSLYDDRIMGGDRQPQSIHSMNSSRSLGVLNKRSPVMGKGRKEFVKLDIGQL